MPYKSLQQEKWAHTPSGLKALGKDKVAEFDAASKGVKLPNKVAKRGMLGGVRSALVNKKEK